MAAAGVGFCGALTTYSTFGYETLRLAQDRAWFYAPANTAASILAGLGTASCGLTLAQASPARLDRPSDQRSLSERRTGDR